jgi:hypothetical protein
MRVDVIPDSDGNGEYLIVHGEIDRASAEAHFFDRHMTLGVELKYRVVSKYDLIAREDPQKVKETLSGMAAKSWPAALAEMRAEPVPEYLTALLSAEDKKQQIRLLKGATITAKQLGAFVLEAEQYGFTYSRYLETRLPGSVDRSELPRFFEKQADGTIKTAGHTSMSDTQLKQVLEQRKSIVATILDKGDDWHCFFATYRGLAGEENYKEAQGGQPHFHYISSKWGSVTRQQVVDGVRSGKYVSTNVHIDLLDFDTTQAEAAEQNHAQELPPLPAAGTGLLDNVWLGTNVSVYAHYYPAGKNVASCGRYNTVEQVRAAWANKNTMSKPHCPNCERRIATSAG